LISELVIIENIVGPDILYQFKCTIGSTAQEVFGFKNLTLCQAAFTVAVSDSQSQSTQATIKSGLSSTAQNEVERLYQSSPHSTIHQGAQGFKCEGYQ